MFLGVSWNTWIALGGAAIAALMALSAERSRRAAAASAARANTHAEKSNEIQSRLYALSSATASHDRIRPVFEAMKTVAKTVGYDGRWKDADALLAKIAPEFDWVLKGLKEYHDEFRKRFRAAYEIQLRKESGLKGWERDELQPKADELKAYFREQGQNLVEVFAPYLDPDK